MHRSVWSHLLRRRSALPTRDLFDADRDRARHKPGCALCRLVREHDQQVMHSFLWEFCTDPHVGAEIARYWGFCPYHTWSLAVLEHERLGDGLGITIVYQALLKQLLRFLTFRPRAQGRDLALRLPTGPEIGSAACRFCQIAQREEAQFLTRLLTRIQHVIGSDEGEDWFPLQMELCFPRMNHLLEACSKSLADRPSPWHKLLHGRQHGSLSASQQQGIQTLATLLSQHTMQRVSETYHSTQSIQNDWSQITRNLAFLVGDREALPVHTGRRPGEAVSRQLLLVAGKRSRLQSPANQACPVCVAAAFACITTCIRAFERQESLPAAATFCQSHHWILAASIFVQEPVRHPDTIDRYRSWLKEQSEQQFKTLTTSEEGRSFQHEQNCMVCSYAAEMSAEGVASITQGLRQGGHDSCIAFPLRIPDCHGSVQNASAAEIALSAAALWYSNVPKSGSLGGSEHKKRF